MQPWRGPWAVCGGFHAPHAWFFHPGEGFGLEQPRFCHRHGTHRSNGVKRSGSGVMSPKTAAGGDTRLDVAPSRCLPSPGAGRSPTMRRRHMMVSKYFPSLPGRGGPASTGSRARAQGPEAAGTGTRSSGRRGCWRGGDAAGFPAEQRPRDSINKELQRYSINVNQRGIMGETFWPNGGSRAFFDEAAPGGTER